MCIKIRPSCGRFFVTTCGCEESPSERGRNCKGSSTGDSLRWGSGEGIGFGVELFQLASFDDLQVPVEGLVDPNDLCQVGRIAVGDLLGPKLGLSFHRDDFEPDEA